MIIEVSGNGKNKKVVFDIIRSREGMYKSPAYFPFGPNMVAVFEKKDIEQKLLSVSNTIKVGKFLNSLKREDIPEKYVIITVNGPTFSIVIKNSTGVNSFNEFKSDIPSLVRLYENYKEYQFFYLENESMDKMIRDLGAIYSDSLSFTTISEKIEKEDYDKVQYNNSFSAKIKELQEKLFPEKVKKAKKEKEIVDADSFSEEPDRKKIIGIVAVLLTAGLSYGGWTYYSAYKAEILKKELAEKAAKNKKNKPAPSQKPLEQVNRNVNALNEIRQLIESGKYYSFEISQDRIKGIFQESFSFPDDAVITNRIGDKRIGEILFKKEDIIKKNEYTSTSPVTELFSDFKKTDFSDIGYGYSISRSFKEKELISFLEELSYNNKINYTGFIIKREAGLDVLINITGR